MKVSDMIQAQCRLITDVDQLGKEWNGYHFWVTIMQDPVVAACLVAIWPTSCTWYLYGTADV